MLRSVHSTEELMCFGNRRCTYGPDVKQTEHKLRIASESVQVVADVVAAESLGDITNTTIAQGTGDLRGHVTGERPKARLDEAVLKVG